MTGDKVQAAVDQVADVLAALAAPDRMTKVEALAFYRGVAAEAATWAQVLAHEVNR